VEVQEAVADPEWQQFRLSLKGETTKYKLAALRLYFVENAGEAVRIRVDNYLKALARGGQIAVSTDYLQDLLDEKLVIRK
jgi:hypothetical protein